MAEFSAECHSMDCSGDSKVLWWISTHFGCASVEIFWELGSYMYVTEFAVSLLLMAIKLQTLKPKPRV